MWIARRKERGKSVGKGMKEIQKVPLCSTVLSLGASTMQLGHGCLRCRVPRGGEEGKLKT